ncbi:MAG: septum formation protein Maf [Alphaproteobacteria bacterium]|nr:septum formation protein Maf [Alphaproteobacteria bacterium]
MDEPLILASASPARKELLAAAGLKVRVEPASVDEQSIKRIFAVDRRPAADCALALAEAKAQEVAGHHQHALVVGADQILVCGSVWFNKAADLGDARAQLQALRGRTHELITAVCVVREAARIWHTISSAKLTMRHFSDAFLDVYLGAEHDAILGSVGGYRLEGRGIQLFADIQGDYFAILGLPLLELFSFLRTRDALTS